MLAEEALKPCAIIAGQPLMEMPADLFIPPDALEVLLDSFSGPLDLLLYLIKKDNIDILDIPIAHITRQYLQYINLLEVHRLELAAEYLLMAALLAEIKSRFLLPKISANEDELEEDPRMELVRKLQLYEQFKNAALKLDEIPRAEREHFRFSLNSPELTQIIIQPDVELEFLVNAMMSLMKKQDHQVSHQISREPLSIRERMASILDRLSRQTSLYFTELFNLDEGRMGIAVSFIAILELARQSCIRISQSSPFSAILIEVVHHES